MYSSVVPSYSSSSDDKKGSNEVINADDPRNQERIERMLEE